MLHNKNENKNIWWFLCFSSVTILWTLVFIILRVFNIVSWSGAIVLLPLLTVSVFSFIVLNVVAIMEIRESVNKNKAYDKNYFLDGEESEFSCVDNFSKEELLDKLSSNVRV